MVVLALVGLAAVVAVGVLVAGVLDGDEGSLDIVLDGTETGPLPEVAAGEVHLDQVRVSEGVVVAAGYLSIVAGPGGDTLVGAASPAAADVVLHQMNSDGTMAVVDEVAVPDDAELLLVPGSLHLMLEDLHEPLEPAGTVELTLVFERAGAVTTTAPVLPYTRVIDPSVSNPALADPIDPFAGDSFTGEAD